MSSSLNSVTSRRQFLALLAAWPLAGLASVAVENAIETVKPAGAKDGSMGSASNVLANLKRRGTGNFRRFGFLIYEATLWSGSDNPLRPPLALKLTYKRNIAGSDIAQASVKEIRNLGLVEEAELKLWGAQMESLFPDVHPNDHILGLYLENGAQFFYNDRPIGRIDDAAFARAFFGIWLDPKTSAPDLRNELLKSAPA